MKYSGWKSLSFFLLIKLLLLSSVLYSHPNNHINCREDYWVDKVESSKQKVISSSTLKQSVSYNYNIENLFDGDTNTCWCVSGDTNGIDEFIILKIPYGIKGIRIVNGVAKNSDLFKINNRVKKIYLGFITLTLDHNRGYDLCTPSQKYNISFQIAEKDFILLKDVIKEQDIIFSSLKYFSWGLDQFNSSKYIYLVIGIADIYKGSLYNDTCISEIKIIK